MQLKRELDSVTGGKAVPGVALLALAAFAACSRITLEADSDGSATPGDRIVMDDGKKSSDGNKSSDGKVTPGDLVREWTRDSSVRAELGKVDARREGGLTDTAGPVTGWAVSAGGTGLDSAFPIALDGGGNFIVAGPFAGTATIGSTTLTAAGYLQTGLFVAKLAPTGSFLWAVGLQGASDIFGDPGSHLMLSTTGLAVDGAGNVFVAGQFAGTAVFGSTTLTSQGDNDVFVAKLDATGKVLWAVGVGGQGYEAVNRLALDGSGNLTIAGEFATTASFGGTSLTAQGQSDGFVARLDGTGKVVWAVQAASSGNTAAQEEMGIAVGVDVAGNTYASGRFFGTATLGLCTVTAGKKNQADSYVAKLDPSGKCLWASTYSSPIHFLADLLLDGSGNLYLAGGELSNNTVALVVTKVDPSGKFLWAATASSAGGTGGYFVPGSWGLGLVLDAAGDIIVVGLAGDTTTFGALALTSAGDKDAFVAKLDPSGTFVAAELAGGTADDLATSVRSCGTDLCIAGGFGGSVKFGGTTLTSKGGRDAFVWRRPPL